MGGIGEMYLLAGLTISLLLNLYQFVGISRLRNVIQGAVDKAERDRAEMVRIPFNQLVMMGFKARHGLFRDREFNQKPGRHPATLPAARRRKL